MTNAPTKTIVLDDEALVAEMRAVSENLVSDWYRESQHRDELVDEIAITLTATHRRAEARTETSMRSVYIEKVKTLPMPWAGAMTSHERVINSFREQLVTALESVSIQEQEPHQHDWYGDGNVLRCYDCTDTQPNP